MGMTETLSPKDVAELWELLAKATPPPWESRGATFDAVNGPQIHGCCHFEEITIQQAASNCALIAALYNAAPALLALASQSLEREAEIRMLQAVVTAARKMPRWAPKGGGASTKHTYQLQACDVWTLDSAFAELDRALAQQPAAKEGV